MGVEELINNLSQALAERGLSAPVRPVDCVLGLDRAHVVGLGGRRGLQVQNAVPWLDQVRLDAVGLDLRRTSG